MRPLSRGDPRVTGRKLAAPGRPGTADGLVAKGGAPGGAAPYVTGRARNLAARGGYVNPASKGCLTQHPWRLPPLHHPRAVREGLPKPRTHCAGRRRKLGCLKLRIGNREAHRRQTFTTFTARLARATQYSGPAVIHTKG